MPITPAQLALGANYQLEAYAKEDPIDQFTQARPFSAWLISKKKMTVRSGGGFRTASAFATVRFRIADPCKVNVGFKFNVWLREIIEHLADGGADQVPGVSDG